MKAPELLTVCLAIGMAIPVFVRAQSPIPATKADTSFVDTSKTFTKVDIESAFPGGPRAWLEFLNAHLVYPRKAVRKKIEGVVVLQFIVDRDGSMTDLQALTGDDILREAALKAMADSPKWLPAVQNGRKVKSYKKQPIVFKLTP